jgi:cell division protein FtsA
MYSTCIGLILKGYNDHDHQYQAFLENFQKVKVTPVAKEENPVITEVAEPIKTEKNADNSKRRIRFWDKFKYSVIDLFSEDDQMLNR